MKKGFMMGHLQSQKTPPNTVTRDSLMKSQKGIGLKPEVRKARRLFSGPDRIAAGKSHREDETVRRHDEDGNGVGPTTRVKPRPTSAYHPRVEDRKHDRKRKEALRADH